MPIGIGGAGETGAVDRFPPEHLNHLQALEVLLEVGIELPQFFAHPVVGLAVTALEPKDSKYHRNLAEYQQQAQAPLDRNHRDGDHDQGDQICQHPHSAAAKNLGEGIHVAGEPGEQLAHRRAVVEPQRQGHGMGEQVVADAGRQPLPHGLHIEGLESLQAQAHQHSR